MKIKIDIDCTPEEARAFFGLPDVAPLQAAMLEVVQARLTEAVQGADLEALMKAWLPAGMQGFETLQKMFWGAMDQTKGDKK